MASTYVNDLRLNELGTGDGSGTWGTTTNTNLELIAEALSYGTEAITTNADTHASAIADGSTDPARSMYIKYTGALDSDCTITISPNTISRVHFIENATTDSGSSGPYNIIISQGSGSNVTIGNGKVSAVYLDGAGSGAAVVDAFTDLSIAGDFSVAGTLLPSGDTSAGDAAAIGYTSALGVIVTGQGSTNDITLVNDADATVLAVPTGTTNVDIVGVATAETFEPDGDTSAGDNAAIGYTAAEGIIVTGQGSTNDITIKNDADADVLVVPTGTTNVDIVGVATAETFEPDGDTAAGDNAAIGYTAAEGIIVTGQGSTNDVTIKNDADADVLVVPTGTTNVDIVGVATAATFEPDGDTSAGDSAAIGFTAAEGLILTGQGSGTDVTIKNDADATVASIATGTTIFTINDDIGVSGRAVGHVTTDNDGSFDLAVGNDFQCTPSGNFTLTFTNAAAGQSGNILLINSGGHTVSAHADVAINATALTAITTAGTYHLAYYCSAASGNNTIAVSASGALT